MESYGVLSLSACVGYRKTLLEKIDLRAFREKPRAM